MSIADREAHIESEPASTTTIGRNSIPLDDRADIAEIAIAPHAFYIRIQCTTILCERKQHRFKFSLARIEMFSIYMPAFGIQLRLENVDRRRPA